MNDMTDTIDWNQESQAIVDELLADGSDPDGVYQLEHHFACDDFNQLEKAAVAIFNAGYQVSDAEEVILDDGKKMYSFDVLTQQKLDVEAIVEEIQVIKPLAAQHQVAYDGWGTYFIEPKPQ